jgi:hypothetical protein
MPVRCDATVTTCSVSLMTELPNDFLKKFVTTVDSLYENCHYNVNQTPEDQSTANSREVVYRISNIGPTSGNRRFR